MAPDDPSSALRANLLALGERSSALVERLCWPSGGDDTRVSEGRVMARVGREWVDLEAAPLPQWLDGRDVLWHGVGGGDLLRLALELRPEARFTAYERDPWLLRTALTRHDFAGDLRSGRLRLLLGVDELDALAGSACVVPHPVLGAMYGAELARWTQPQKGRRPRAGVCVGELFVTDIVRSLETRGYEVVMLDDRRWSVEELAHAVRTARIHFLVRVNYTNGLAEFAEEEGVPLLVWEIDPATDGPRPLPVSAAGTHIFTYRSRHVEVYRSAGFLHVEHLPLASPVDRRRPQAGRDLSAYDAPVAFVGASMTATAAELRSELDALYGAFAGSEKVDGFHARCSELLELQRDAVDWILPELLQREFEAFCDHLDEDLGGPNPAQLLGEGAASDRRIALVESLSEEGIHVWGDGGFRRAKGIRYRGPARFGDELSSIYSAARINVDIGRWYQNDIVTMRVFDVLACGGFLIAERSRDLEDLFEVGQELEAYSTPAELQAKVRHYLDRPEEARKIAEAGRAAVLERHRFDARIGHMLDRAGLGADKVSRGPTAQEVSCDARSLL